MATKNTLIDLAFAEQYVNFLAARSQDRETRARAALLSATIKLLDVEFPLWRQNLIDELDKEGITKTTMELFPLPVVDSGAALSTFMTSILGRDTDIKED